MEEVIDQVMRTYGLMVNLSATEERSARERLGALVGARFTFVRPARCRASLNPR
jgi:hypothetical protein